MKPPASAGVTVPTAVGCGRGIILTRSVTPAKAGGFTGAAAS